jgi:hypothetical protein
VRGIPRAKLLPVAALEGSADGISVVDIDGAARLVIGVSGLSGSGNIASSGLVPLVQQDLLRKGAESRVDGDVTAIGAAGAGEGRGGRGLQVGDSSSGGAEGDAVDAVDRREKSGLQAVG